MLPPSFIQTGIAYTDNLCIEPSSWLTSFSQYILFYLYLEYNYNNNNNKASTQKAIQVGTRPRIRAVVVLRILLCHQLVDERRGILHRPDLLGA